MQSPGCPAIELSMPHPCALTLLPNPSLLPEKSILRKLIRHRVHRMELTNNPQDAKTNQPQKQQLRVYPAWLVNHIHCLVEEGVAEETSISPALHMIMVPIYNNSNTDAFQLMMS